MPRSHTVFICRAGRDEEQVRELVRLLRLQSRGSWKVVDDVPLRSDWLTLAQAEIANADVFLFVASVAGVQSPGCRLEIDYLAENEPTKPTLLLNVGPVMHELPQRWPMDGPVVDGTAGFDRSLAADVLTSLSTLVGQRSSGHINPG